MNGKHYAQTQTTQRGRTCSLIHGSWRRVGIKLAAAGACALMAGQLLLPSVALASELEGAVATQVEASVAPAAPTAVDGAATSTDAAGPVASGWADNAAVAPQDQAQQKAAGASADQGAASAADANAATRHEPVGSAVREDGGQATAAAADATNETDADAIMTDQGDRVDEGGAKAGGLPDKTSIESTAISAVAVENVKTDYVSGETPRATAMVPEVDADKYEIVYECWEEMESDDQGSLKPVAYWFSSGGRYPTNAKRITQFEGGKLYMYSVELRPKGDNVIAQNCSVSVNGRTVMSIKTLVGVLVPNGASMRCKPAVEIRTIDVVEIDGVTIGFKDGDKPVFTGRVPDGASYAYRCEWWDLDSETGAMSTDFGSFFKNKFKTFEGGKTYRYGVYVTTYGDVGNVRYVFGPNTKLKINGRYVNYTRYQGDDSDGSDGTMWVVTDLAITPEGAPVPTDPEKPNAGGSETPATKPSDNSGQKENGTGSDNAKPRPASDGAKVGSKSTPADAKADEKTSDGELAATGDDAALTVVAMGVAGATVAAAGLAASKRRG